jgi:hypothetical protein
MLPSPAAPLAFRSVTFASASSTHSFCGSLASFGRSASILHGELYGILLAALFATASTSSSSPPSIHTDHLNAVTILNDALAHPPLPHSWSSLPARSMYRWIYSVLSSSQTHPTIHHVRAHTRSQDPVALANGLVDRLASSSQSLTIPPPPVPLPTFVMDKFTPYLPPYEYIDSHLPSLIQSLLASRSFFHASFSPQHILSPLFYDTHLPPLHPYTRASSSYSAVVQLYARSGQLPTNLSCAARFHDGSRLCRFGCSSLEDAHHLFVECHFFEHLRDEYSSLLVSDVDHMLSNTSLPNPLLSHILHMVTHLFKDNVSWPLGSSRFYLGLIPPLLPPNLLNESLSLEATRLVTRLAHSCHSHAIRLTARIWGTVVRHYIAATSPSKAPTKSDREALLRNSQLALPPHLHYLLKL